MINITHVYAYYGAHSALKECIAYKVPFMLSFDNESAISICVKHKYRFAQTGNHPELPNFKTVFLENAFVL